MPVVSVRTPFNLNNDTFLVKTIRFRDGRDYWNTFLASVMQDPNSSEFDALAHLHLRTGPRTHEIRTTFGMMPDRSVINALSPTNSLYTWHHRRMIPPNPSAGDPRAVVHDLPMYTPEEKKGYSKPQSTTLISRRNDIHPKLFSGFSGPNEQPMSGVFFPLHERYCLINRFSNYDGATVSRPYDCKTDNQRVWPSARTLTHLLQDEDLKGNNGFYTEILARLKMYDPRHPLCNSKIQEDIGRQPGFLICKQYNCSSEISVWTMLVTIKRAFDFLLCLRRQYGPNATHCIPIALYDYRQYEIDDCIIFEKVILFTGQESLLKLFDICFPEWKYRSRIKDKTGRVIRPDWLSVNFDDHLKRLIYQVYMQQYIYLADSEIPQPQLFDTNLPWYLYLTWDAPEIFRGGELFYLETLMALVSLCYQDQTIIRRMSLRFKNFIEKFLIVYDDKKTLSEKYIAFALKADFAKAPYKLEMKINPRFPAPIPPNFPYQNGQRRISYAIQEKKFDEFDQLLTQPGLDINKRDLDAMGRTPLLTAFAHFQDEYFHPIYSSSEVLINRLLRMPEIDVSVCSSLGHTVLMYALCYCRNIELIRKILNHPQTNINALNCYNHSTLYYATHAENDTAAVPEEIFIMILNHPALNLNLIVSRKNRPVFSYLLKEYIDYCDNHKFPLDESNQPHTKTIYHQKLYYRKILLFLEKTDLQFDNLVFQLKDKHDSNNEIRLAALRLRKFQNGHLSHYEEGILKSLTINECHHCKIRHFALRGDKHHCRECLNGFCNKCGLRIPTAGEWYCVECSAILGT